MGEIAEKFGLEHSSREGFLRLVDFLLAELPPRRMFTARRTRPPAHEAFEFYPHPVFDLPLSGEKEISFSEGTEILRPGDVFQLPPAAWKLPRWTRPHEMACLVFQEKFLRITYVELDRPPADGIRPVSTVFFHTGTAPGEEIRALLRLLERLGLAGDPGGAAPELFRGLLRLVRVMLERDESPLPGKAQSTFRKVRHYLTENSGAAVTRAETARRFKLNPGYLSRLFRAQQGCSFSEFLIRLRLEQAAMLLRETDLLVDEIADRCGYQSTTFFTAAFKKRFGHPPARYRNSHIAGINEERGGAGR